VTDDDMARLTEHESAHAQIALLYGLKLRAVTVNGGTRADGCMTSEPLTVPPDALARLDPDAPFCLWPAEVRRRIESDAMFYLAGDAADRVLRPPQTGRTDEPVAVQAALIASKLPPPTDTERAEAVAAVNDDKAESDAVRAAFLATVAYPGDPMGQARWLAFMAAECESLVLAHQSGIRRLAAVVREVGTVGGQAAAGVLKRRLWATG
jgi:hypothetical protein